MGLLDSIRKGLGLSSGVKQEPTVTIQEAPIDRIATVILQMAIKDRATEIRIEPSLEASPVDFVVDGALVEMMTVPPHIKEPLLEYFKAASGILVQSGVEQSGEMKFTHAGQEYNIDVEFVLVDYGDLLVLTFVQPNSEVPASNEETGQP